METGAVWWYTRPATRSVLHVARQQVEVEVPTRRAFEIRSRARAETVNGDEAGWDAEALLGSAVRDVDGPAVDRDLDAAQRRDHVDQEQCVTLAAAERFDVVAHPRRGLCVHHGDDRRRRVRRQQPVGIDGLPQGASTRTTSAPRRPATSHMRSPNTPFTPTTTGAPGPDEIDERSLHAGRSRSTDREGQAHWPWRRRDEAARSCCRAGPGTAGRGARATGLASAMVTSGYGFDGPGPISKRSVIPTGAS